MHILVTNDDGPPDPVASPYIYEFVRILQSPPFNHTVSVVIPSQQRSWIGKAHLLPASPAKAAQKPAQQVESAAAADNATAKALPKNEEVDEYVRPVYYDAETGAISDTLPAQHSDGSTPMKQNDYWVLIPGTPAACTQLGLFHHQTLFPSRAARHGNDTSAARATIPDPSPDTSATSMRSPFDLVISGPNHGRNTTAAFALSSGTLGGALEAAVCGVKAVALSFAFFTRNESEAVVRQACKHSVRIIERLFQEWGPEPTLKQGDSHMPDLFSVNVPLIEDVDQKPVKWTWMLDNKWMAGSLYKAVTGGGSDAVPNAAAAASRPMFKWAPTFSDVWKTVEESAPGNDGLTIREHCSSVTPLKANFHGLHGLRGYEGEMKL